jgi:helix-turn-helix protein
MHSEEYGNFRLGNVRQECANALRFHTQVTLQSSWSQAYSTRCSEQWRVRRRRAPLPGSQGISFLKSKKVSQHVLPGKHEAFLSYCEIGAGRRRSYWTTSVTRNYRALEHKEALETHLATRWRDRQWCDEKHGRQSEVASYIGVRPSTVNDWFTGRKNAMGEQALAIQEFLRRQRRSQKH